jgi:predicted nucleic acid-binding protein
VRSIVVDSGFLIGLFDESDPWHGRCKDFLRPYRGRFLTTEAVLAESLALLSTRQQRRCLAWLADAAHARLLEVDREPLDFRAVDRLVARYADQPMDFADATLVLLAARMGISEVVSSDRRDFSVYRLPGSARFTNLLSG